MPTKRIGLGEMWKSEESGDVDIVMSFCRELFSSYALSTGMFNHKHQTIWKSQMLRQELSGENVALASESAEFVYEVDCQKV